MTLAIGSDTASPFRAKAGGARASGSLTGGSLTGSPSIGGPSTSGLTLGSGWRSSAKQAGAEPSGLAFLVENELDAETRRAARVKERRAERLARYCTVGAFALGSGWAIYFAQLLLAH